MQTVDRAREAQRFAGALAFVLHEETGYPQPAGGPYVRLIVTSDLNAKRHRKGLVPWPLGAYVLDRGTLRCGETGAMIPVPDHPDGMAFDDHPKDPGGRTGMGILQREYDAWRHARGLETQDVWRIGDDELAAIYRRQYWDACRCDDLEPGVAEFTFNTAVNCGVDIAGRQLQMAVKVDRVDGRIGDVTVATARAQPALDVVKALAAAQRARYPTLRNFNTFGENWMARTERVETFALARAHDLPLGSPWEVSVVEDIGPPEERTPRAHEEPPETAAQSSTVQAAVMVDWMGRLVPMEPMFRVLSDFRAAGKSLLSLDFALAILSSPDVLVAVGIAIAITAPARHIVAERVRKLTTLGV